MYITTEGTCKCRLNILLTCKRGYNYQQLSLDFASSKGFTATNVFEINIYIVQKYKDLKTNTAK